MASAANQDAHGNPVWGGAPPGGAQPWGSPGWQGPSWQGSGWQGPGWQAPDWRGLGPGWVGPPLWQQMGISRPLCFALMILGFIFFWPVGLVLLFMLIWSGRMGCWGRRRWAAYQNQGGEGRGPAAPWQAWKNWGSADRAPPSSGNRAFDEYRAETLRRLEDEQKEFGAFLERLRFAKDKAEFDEFMQERRHRPSPPPVPPESAPQT